MLKSGFDSNGDANVVKWSVARVVKMVEVCLASIEERGDAGR